MTLGDPLHGVASALDAALPADPTIERAALGAILLNEGALPRVLDLGMRPDDYSREEHRAIFSRMCRMADEAKSIDLLTVRDELSKHEELQRAGGAAYLASLTDSIPDIAGVEKYARIVVEKSLARTLAKTFARATASATDEESIGAIVANVQPLLDSCLKRASACKGESALGSLTSLSDFLSEPAPVVEWLVDGLFLRGGIALLCAKPKAGKSTLSRDVAFAVATGMPFLGRRSQRGKVVFIALEEHRDRLREQFQRMGFAGEEEIYIHVGPAPEGGIAWLKEIVREHRPAVVVIDPVLKLVRVSDANDYAVTSAALEPLTAIARDSGACLLLVHHANKFGDGSGGESVLGSTAIFGLADTLVLMKRRDDQTRTVSTIQRYGSDLPETVLQMDPDNGQLAIAGSYEEMRLDTVITKIADALKSGRPMSELEIREAVGIDRTLVARAIRYAVESKALRRDGRGRKGSPFTYTVEGRMIAS